MLLESLVIFFFEGLHELGDVTTKDVVSESLLVQLLGFRVVSWESLGGVRDEDTTVRGTLESTKDSGSGRGSLETDVQVALEWSGLVFTFESLSLGHGSIWLSDTFVLVGEAQEGQGSSGDEETGSVGGRPVAETMG